MNLRSRFQDEEPEMNLTSLIDVVLLLLIFFMVSTTFVDEARIRIQLPQASNEPAPEQQKTPIEVAVTASGEYRGFAVQGKQVERLDPGVPIRRRNVVRYARTHRMPTLIDGIRQHFGGVGG